MMFNENSIFKKFILLLFLVIGCKDISAQLTIEEGISTYVIDFDNTLIGVSNGSFAGHGFSMNPVDGQLDAGAWATTGWSEGIKVFGDINTTGDHARGMDDGGVSTGGLYAFNTGGGNIALGIQSTASDFTPGTLTLKIHNNSTSVINEMDIDYIVYERNDQNHSSTLNLSISYNNTNFSNITSGSHSSVAAAGAVDWVPYSKTIQLSGLQIDPGSDFYIRWSGSDASGSGSRDELALDDISIVVEGQTMMCEEPTAQGSNFIFDLVTANSIQASFTGGTADKYLVIQSTNPTLGVDPIDGVEYIIGDQIGSGEVIQYNAGSSINSIGLIENTSYYYFIFASNDICTGGPDYLIINPLTASATTDENNFGNYYDGINNETCETLKTALHNLIKGHTSVSYGSLWTHYQSTDDHLNDSGNETIVWDMYSDNPTGAENEFTFVTEQCGNYQQEGDCYNREHTFPKSWWGGSTSAPQYTDIYAVVPTDGWINGIRSNNPYGEVQGGTETQIMDNGCSLGSSSITIPGYSANVFEPIDAYKGDLARGYLYMATRYEDVIAGWENNTTESNAVLDGSSYEVFEPWMLTLLLDWHANDPVDQKEIDRNEAIFAIQGNRNPFIDHPEYAVAIWDACSSSPIDSCIYVYTILDNGAGSLRAAINCSADGDTITFSPDINNTSVIIDSDFVISNKSITILADATANIRVSSSLPQVSTLPSIFKVENSGSLTLTGFSIDGGFGPFGSAIRNFGSLTIENMNFTSGGNANVNSVLVNENGSTLIYKGINTIEL